MRDIKEKEISLFYKYKEKSYNLEILDVKDIFLKIVMIELFIKNRKEQKINWFLIIICDIFLKLNL